MAVVDDRSGWSHPLNHNCIILEEVPAFISESLKGNSEICWHGFGGFDRNLGGVTYPTHEACKQLRKLVSLQ